MMMMMICLSTRLKEHDEDDMMEMIIDVCIIKIVMCFFLHISVESCIEAMLCVFFCQLALLVKFINLSSSFFSATIK